MSGVLQPPSSCNIYTPAVLADAMVRTLEDFPTARWLEPCVGKGAFLSAMAKFGVDAKRVVGVDLDSTPEPTDKLARVKRYTEFLAWAMTTPSRFDRIVANPPFIAISCLPEKVQQAAEAHRMLDGSRITRGGNCWHAFFCASLRLLRPRGSLAFVLPAAFEYANYAGALRDQLPNHFERIIVHRCRSPLFDDAEDGSVVVIAKDYKSKPKLKRRYVYDDLPRLVQGISREGGQPVVTATSIGREKSSERVLLGDVMSVTIGAVTGDAKYFLMNEQSRVERDLPIEAMQRVLSRSHHLYRDAMTLKLWKQLRDDNERVWLFRPEGAVLRRNSVKHYLDLSGDEGGCKKGGYKISNRDPWYRTPLPDSPHGFLTGMSHHGPVICLNRMRSLSATNTLYTVRFFAATSLAERTRWAMMMLTSCAREQLGQLSRAYPLGLSKIEPGDIQTVRLPRPIKKAFASDVYRSAVDALLSGDEQTSRAIADRWAE